MFERDLTEGPAVRVEAELRPATHFTFQHSRLPIFLNVMSAYSESMPLADMAAERPSNTRAIPAFWPSLLLAFAASCITVGIMWDISWHETIGRDTFWTPAHMVIYLGGALGGCVGDAGWHEVRSTFLAGPAERAATVRLFGARAPLGAWISIWGAVAMITSGPFDNWWHNAYGLDVKIISPPHVVLGLGMFGISFGALLLVLTRQNRLQDGAGSGLFIWVGGMFLVLGGVFILEYSFPNLQHASIFYKVCALVFPFRLVALGRAARTSWPTTRVTAVYVLVVCLMAWILPLFPAQPKLAPIYNAVTHMVPLPFPLLLIFPAMALDLLLRPLGGATGWRRAALAVLLGAVFLAVFIPVQWYFSQFLISPHADNWFFVGNRVWGYGSGLGDWDHPVLAREPVRFRRRFIDPARPGHHLGAGRRRFVDWPVAGRLDAEGPAMKLGLLAMDKVWLVGTPRCGVRSAQRADPTFLARSQSYVMRLVLLVLLTLFFTMPAQAHVGSPGCFFDGMVGPWPVRVTIRMPGVVPGRAEIFVQVQSKEPVSVTFVPLASGIAVSNAPPPETAQPMPGATNLYTGELWLMTIGAYSIDVRIHGKSQEGAVQIPVDSIARAQLPLPPLLGQMLLALGLILFCAAIVIIAAAAGESTLPPDVLPGRSERRKYWIAASVTGVVLVLGLVGGKKWWNSGRKGVPFPRAPQAAGPISRRMCASRAPSASFA